MKYPFTVIMSAMIRGVHFCDKVSLRRHLKIRVPLGAPLRRRRDTRTPFANHSSITSPRASALQMQEVTEQIEIGLSAAELLTWLPRVLKTRNQTDAQVKRNANKTIHAPTLRSSRKHASICKPGFSCSSQTLRLDTDNVHQFNRRQNKNRVRVVREMVRATKHVAHDQDHAFAYRRIVPRHWPEDASVEGTRPFVLHPLREPEWSTASIGGCWRCFNSNVSSWRYKIHAVHTVRWMFHTRVLKKMDPNRNEKKKMDLYCDCKKKMKKMDPDYNCNCKKDGPQL